jgi:hypothetical protein
MNLSPEEKREYLWSGLLVIPLITAILGLIIGYLLKWHEPYWVMSVLIGIIGFLSGSICSAALLVIRGMPVMMSRYRTGHHDPDPGDAAALPH